MNRNRLQAIAERVRVGFKYSQRGAAGFGAAPQYYVSQDSLSSHTKKASKEARRFAPQGCLSEKHAPRPTEGGYGGKVDIRVARLPQLPHEKSLTFVRLRVGAEGVEPPTLCL